ncbi:MAG: hypothetical protein ACREL5_06050 [Gemmatimonadales bacterium]
MADRVPTPDAPTSGYQALVHSAGSVFADGLGQFEASGPDANAFVNRVATADLSVLDPGHFVHSLLLRDDATILDRVTIYRFPERIMVLVDADRREAAWQHIVARKRGNLRLRDLSGELAVVAVRGPLTIARVEPVLSAVPGLPGDVTTARFAGIEVFAARASLDGPEGVDLYCRSRDRSALQSALFKNGVHPVTAADWQLHRLEWGIANVGVEIDLDDTPVEAGLLHLVAEGKGAPFPGELALVARRDSGAIKRLAGFHLGGDDIPPVGSRVSVAGVVVDRVRSVGLSPRAGIIGFTALPTTALTPGTPLMFMSSQRTWQGTVAPVPFVSRRTP